jgi:S-adenosylmethionine decarboxylase
MDYKVRGFTRDISGKKHYIDHNITSIQNYIARDTQESYQMIDVNVYQENIFHTKMMLKETELENYLFVKESNLSASQKAEIQKKLQKEVTEIFYGHNYRRKKIKVAD